MSLPNQAIPESKKSQEWGIRNVDAIIRMANLWGGLHRKDALCYDIYYGNQTEKDYEYLTGTDEYRMPARVRSMPIIRPYFDLLQSTAESRPFNPMVFSVDTNSVEGKKDEQAREVVSAYLKRLDDASIRIETAKGMLQMRKEAIGQMMSDEGAGADPQMMLEVHAMGAEIAALERAIGRGEEVMEEEVSRLERKSKYGFQTHKEVTMGHALNYMMRKYDWKRVFDSGFTDLMVVDNEYYRLEQPELGKDPTFRKVHPLAIYYGTSGEAYWLDEAEWVMEVRNMSVANVMAEFGDRLSKDDKGKLEERHPFLIGGSTLPNEVHGAGFNSLPMEDLVGCAPDGVYSGSHLYSADTVRVYQCVWKSVRKLRLGEVQGEDLTIRRLLDDEEIPGKDEKVAERWVIDWWRGTRIGNDIFVDVGRCPFQFRDIDRIGMAYGPYVGYAYNGTDRRPYSTAWAVKDAWILYNLVYYQIELLIALSGIKGVVMDLAQKPKDMEMEQWMYHFKQGIGWIDSMRMAEGTNQRSSYNQFATYDLSFGQSINQLQIVLQGVDDLIGRLIGIPRQRLGEITKDDQVGGARQAVFQSNIVTETRFRKHDAVRKRVLDRILMSMTAAWKDGKRGQYVAGDMGQVMFEIDAMDVDEARFEVFFGDGGKDAEMMERIMGAVSVAYQNGAMGLSQLIGMFRMNSVREMEQTVEHYETLARKQMRESAEAQAMDEERKMRMEAEMKAMVRKTLTDGEQLKAQLDQVRMEFDGQLAEMKAKAQLEGQGIKSETDRYIADQNAGVEMAHLKEMARKTDIETRLKQIELALGIASGSKNVTAGRPKNKASDR